MGVMDLDAGDKDETEHMHNGGVQTSLTTGRQMDIKRWGSQIQQETKVDGRERGREGEIGGESKQNGIEKKQDKTRQDK